jgi:hypothetical protein
VVACSVGILPGEAFGDGPEGLVGEHVYPGRGVLAKGELRGGGTLSDVQTDEGG